MEEEGVCGTCLRKGKPLVKESVENSLTVVCPLCLSTIRKLRAFQRQCVLSAQLLADYSSTIHLFKNWDEYAKTHKQQIYENLVECLESSNTLCLDVISSGEDTEEYTTQITSYNHCERSVNHPTSYCEGMQIITNDKCVDEKEIKKKNKKYINTILFGRNGEKNVKKNKNKREKKIKDKVRKRYLNLVQGTYSSDGLQCPGSDGDDRLQEDAVSILNEVETNEQTENLHADLIQQQEQNDIILESEKELNKSVKIGKKKVRKKQIDENVSSVSLGQPDFDSMFVCRTNLTLEEQLDEMEKRKVSEEFLSSPFKCNKCFIGFKFQYSLDNHTKKHNQESGSIVCVVCTQRFSTQNKHREHVRSHHSQVLQCVMCGKRLKERKRLRDHWEAHLGVVHTCDTCQRGFKTKTALIHHISIHNNQFPCPHCTLVLRSRPTFKKHLLLHSAVRPHACQSCPRTFATREWLELHMQRAHAPMTEQFYCVECDYRFKSSREYKKHLTAKKHTHPSLLTHSCSRCPRRYASQEELSRHMSALHDRVLTYTCPECPARFATTRGLYGHKRRVHMGYVAPKKYSCSYCNKAFRDKYYLTNHIRIHTGDTTHKCTLCLLTFTHTSALTHHIKQAHKDGM